METISYPWAAETPRKRFATPYKWGTGENFVWLKNRLFGPSRNHQNLTTFIPQETQIHAIKPRLRIAFIGDVMPTCGKVFRPGDNLIAFLQDVDYLILNFEGIISADRRVLNGLRHNESIIAFLGQILPPEKVIVSFANNHAADCGWEEFQRCYDFLREHRYSVCGRRDQPSVMLDDCVQVTVCSHWSNQQGAFISHCEKALDPSNRAAFFKILYCHWGYEMQLYPHPRQIEEGKDLLNRWDMVVGHHSHCPQPITQHRGKLLAYSLGNFCYGVRSDRYHHGMIVKSEIGLNARQQWRTGKVTWKFTQQQSLGRGECLVDVARTCRFFSHQGNGMATPGMHA